MFEDQVVGKIAVFTEELGELVRRLRICRFIIFIRNIRSFSTIPGRHIPVFFVDANFLANGASPIALVEAGRKVIQ